MRLRGGLWFGQMLIHHAGEVCDDACQRLEPSVTWTDLL